MLDKLHASLGITRDMPASERLRANLVLAFVGVSVLGQVANMVSMTIAYGGVTGLHGLSAGFVALLLGCALLLRRTRSGLVFGFAFGALHLLAIGMAAFSVPADGYTSVGIHTSLLPGFVAGAAIVGLLASRLALVTYLVGCALLVTTMYHASVAIFPVAGLEGAAYHRAFQISVSVAMASAVTYLIGSTVYRSLDRLERQRNRAEYAEAARAEYTATISHEIRTPLSGLIGLADLLKRTRLDADQEKYVGLIDTSASTLLDIVNDILDAAKVEAGDVTPVSKPLDPSVIATEVCEVFATEAAHRNLWLGVQVEGDLAPGLHGDPRYLRQVLSNLVSNALKFTTEGGVRITVSSSPATDTAQSVSFAVQDTGPGISDADTARVFERFAQTSTAANSGKKGSGLGLHIAHALVAAMGGDLRLVTREGQGACFHFTLALARLPVAPATLPDAA